MEYEKYAELKKDVEIYFAKIIKKRFQEFIEQEYELHFAPDYLSHRLISDLLIKDGLEVYGMNANMDGFQLLLDFKHDYLAIDNFIFSRLSVDFENDGNYSVYLSENSFDDDWTVHLEDEYNRYRMLNEEDFVFTLNEMKNTHLVFILKS
jgi:hypothetical protein